MRTERADPALTILADREKVEQILLNLLSNAAKFTPRGGHVTMVATAHASTVEISVADTGVGIPRDKLTTIFEQFVQVSSSLTREHEPRSRPGDQSRAGPCHGRRRRRGEHRAGWVHIYAHAAVRCQDGVARQAWVRPGPRLHPTPLHCAVESIDRPRVIRRIQEGDWSPSGLVSARTLRSIPLLVERPPACCNTSVYSMNNSHVAALANARPIKANGDESPPPRTNRRAAPASIASRPSQPPREPAATAVGSNPDNADESAANQARHTHLYPLQLCAVMDRANRWTVAWTERGAR